METIFAKFLYNRFFCVLLWVIFHSLVRKHSKHIPCPYANKAHTCLYQTPLHYSCAQSDKEYPSCSLHIINDSQINNQQEKQSKKVGSLVTEIHTSASKKVVERAAEIVAERSPEKSSEL